MKTILMNKRRQNAHINIVPYIDVMLVLLIVFMVTTPLLTTGGQVNLPQANAKKVQNTAKEQQLIVSVTKDARYFFALNQDKQKELRPHELTAESKILFARYPSLKIYVKADESVAYGIEENKDLGEMTLEELAQFSDVITADVFDVLTLEGSVAARDHLGGTAPNQVRAAAARAEALLASR